MKSIMEQEYIASSMQATLVAAGEAISRYKHDLAQLRTADLSRPGSRAVGRALDEDLAQRLGFPGRATFRVVDAELRAYIGPLGAYYVRVNLTSSFRGGGPVPAWSLERQGQDRDKYLGLLISSDYHWRTGNPRVSLM
jgi:hypothetical protein